MNLFKTLPVLSESEREVAKNHLFFAVHFWCELSKLGRREGILSLEELLENEEYRIMLADGTNPFPPAAAADNGYADSESWLFSRLLKLICDGTDSDLWHTIMHYSLCNLEKHVPPATLLSLVIGAQAIRNIQAGEPVLFTKYQLSEMLGTQLCEEFLAAKFPPLALKKPPRIRPEHTEEYKPTDEEQKRNDELWAASESRLKQGNKDGADDEAFVFDDLVLLDDRAVQKVLHVVLGRADLARALQGTDGEVQEKLFRNMSAQAAAEIKAKMENVADESDVQEARKKIIAVVKCLEQTGDIVIAGFEDFFAEKDSDDEAEEESPLEFADIVFANDLGVQRLLREVERYDVVTALHGADETVREKVFCNVSKRVAASFKESLDTRSAKQEEIQQAQERIISKMRHLEDFGELVIERPED